MLHGCWKGQIDIYMAYILVLCCMDRDDELHLSFRLTRQGEDISLDIVGGDLFS